MNVGTPLGLGFASGVNAYLPLLAFAVAIRWLHLYTVNSHFAFITSNWFMIILVILTLLNFVADKIPLIDHGWDAINTVIRPLAGTLVAAASSQNVTLPTTIGALSMQLLPSVSSATGGIHIGAIGLVIVALFGGALAALAHVAKATTRLASTLTTAGFLNIVLSFVEDILVIVIVLIALFIPAIMLILLILFLLIAVPRIFRLWNSRRNSAKSGRFRSFKG